MGYYGKRGEEFVDGVLRPRRRLPGSRVVAWEREAQAAAELGVRVAIIRTGVVPSPDGGALEKMLPFFKLGVGGPVAGGAQWMPWIHPTTSSGSPSPRWTATPGPARSAARRLSRSANREFSRRLGKALHRPAFAPVPGFAVRLLYGDMAGIVTEGQRAVPRRPLELGFAFRHADLDEALRDAVG